MSWFTELRERTGVSYPQRARRTRSKDKLANARTKRQMLVNQCQENGIHRATMGKVSKGFCRKKPSTIGWMRRQLKSHHVTPCC